MVIIYTTKFAKELALNFILKTFIIELVINVISIVMNVQVQINHPVFLVKKNITSKIKLHVKKIVLNPIIKQ